MILVTGATGFLGAELIRQLTSQGIKLRALKRAQSIIPGSISGNKLVEWVTADLNDLSDLEDAFEGIRQVYHCAALVSFNPKDKAKMLRVNIEGTSNVVNLCQEFGVRLLHVSSVAALGNAKKGELITEKDFRTYEADTHSYAISKYEGEMEVWRGIAEGLDAVIVNPSVIIGAGAGHEGSGAIFKLVKEGLGYYTSGATGIVDVADVAKSMIALMNSKESAERFILSSENYNYQRFFTEIAAGYGVKAPAKEAKHWMLGIAWRAAAFAALLTRKPATLTRDAAKSSLNVSLYSNQKVINATSIDFRPVKQSIEAICKQQD